MSKAIKLGANCVVVAGLTVVGLLTYVSLPQFTLEPIQWADRHIERPATMAFWFVYTVLFWAVLASIIAWCMLLLKPRKVVLYGLASAVAFVITGRSWDLFIQGNVYGYGRELVFLLTIPFFYWLFVRQASKRHNKSLKRDAQKGAP